MSFREEVSRLVGARMCRVEELGARGRELEARLTGLARPDEAVRLARELRAIRAHMKTLDHEIQSLRFFLNRSPHVDT